MSNISAPNNRTIRLDAEKTGVLLAQCISPTESISLPLILDKTLFGNSFQILPLLPKKSIDLLLVDPPYNLTKQFGDSKFLKTKEQEYEDWLDSWLSLVVPLLKQTASIYICCDWQSSTAIHNICQKYFIIRNRITWEREKGRGAKANWKNCSEDIWYCTVSEKYTFNVDAVKLRRRVLAPYRNEDNVPKDWEETTEGNFRLTSPSNLMTDISIPFWSMPENTDHPTQKPEKLMAKLILASTNERDIVLDPFLGSGTTSVVSKKLNRHYIGIEEQKEYCALAEYRLAQANIDKNIQGYAGGYFWERNTMMEQMKMSGEVTNKNEKRDKVKNIESMSLFNDI
jgi:site-specific DNA-methyltransferase (adenine-specific)